jgi:glycosyltransferase involved in cell wall biosynthesis
MQVWIVNPFDPLPGEEERPGRYGLLARTLVRRGHAVTWVSSEFSHRFKSRREASLIQSACRERGFEAILIETPPYRGNVSWQRVRNHRAFAAGVRALDVGSSKADVVLASTPPPRAAQEASRLAGRLGARFVLDTQDLWPETFCSLLPPPLRILGRALFAGTHGAARRAASAADALTAVADGYLAHSQRLAGREVPAETFPLGIDLSHFDEQAAAVPLEERFAKPPGQTWFVYGGGISRNYDLPALVEAARLAQAAWGSKARVILAGSGEQAPWLRGRIAELGVENVELMGFLPYGRWASLLKEADASFLAIRSTSLILFPNKTFDYMAGQTFILNTLGGTTEQLLRENGCGCTYPENDPQGCFRAMARVMDDPEGCAESARRGRRLVETRFDHTLVYERMAQFLEQLAVE